MSAAADLLLSPTATLVPSDSQYELLEVLAYMRR